MKHLRPAKHKKIPALAALLILTALALLFSGGIVTLARYFMEKGAEGAVVAKPFYFSSDKLTEDCPYYQLDSTGGDTVELKFLLSNSADKFRYTGFSCAYEVKAEGGETLKGPETVVFSGEGPDPKSISCTLDASLFADGQAVTVTASAAKPDAPYDKTISARFGFTRPEGQLQYSVSSQNGAVVLELSGISGTAAVSWPAGLVPDQSSGLLAVTGDHTGTVSMEKGERCAITFLKTNSQQEFTAADFTVS